MSLLIPIRRRASPMSKKGYTKVDLEKLKEADKVPVVFLSDPPPVQNKQ